jgi:hypothetical protein
MRKTSLTGVACTTLLWAGTVLATPTPQQNCDNARITAWKEYVSCVESAVAKDAKGVTFDHFAAFAKCRHTYFKKWIAFQNPNRKPPLAGSTCREDTPGIGGRFTEPLVADGTVTDNLTGLVWEQKSDLDGLTDFVDPHDADNTYTWSTGSGAENGAAFTSFLGTVNGGAGFGGANGWRLPTLVELQTIVLDFACTGAGGGSKCSCPVSPPSPCVDPELDAASTQPFFYWSATTYVPDPLNAWGVEFSNGGVNPSTTGKTSSAYTRAVRGGL